MIFVGNDQALRDGMARSYRSLFRHGRNRLCSEPAVEKKPLRKDPLLNPCPPGLIDRENPLSLNEARTDRPHR